MALMMVQVVALTGLGLRRVSRGQYIVVTSRIYC